MASDKYERFSKVFAKLSDESQDKLVKIAHRLLKTHQYVKHNTGKKKSVISQNSGKETR
jgi:hypothetical protein